APADHARADPAQRDAAEVARGVEVGDVGLQRRVRVVGGRRHGLGDHVEQRVEAGVGGQLAVGGAGAGGPPGPAARVDDREVEQLPGGVLVELQLVGQLQQQLEALVDDLGAAGV